MKISWVDQAATTPSKEMMATTPSRVKMVKTPLMVVLVMTSSMEDKGATLSSSPRGMTSSPMPMSSRTPSSHQRDTNQNFLVNPLLSMKRVIPPLRSLSKRTD